jgi:hypothetical protein
MGATGSTFRRRIIGVSRTDGITELGESGQVLIDSLTCRLMQSEEEKEVCCFEFEPSFDNPGHSLWLMN